MPCEDWDACKIIAYLMAKDRGKIKKSSITSEPSLTKFGPLKTYLLPQSLIFFMEFSIAATILHDPVKFFIT